MPKLTLEVEALQVESFGTSNTGTVMHGTVRGQEALAGATGTKPSCISCYNPTDPCICDPIKLTALC
ncbi:hypothetical protein [Longimicrobium terrae]|uniref:Uncharacterized protein n=1 Tax=Longimicrobium terrae TaxID=1639882 RepID=A0A841GK72_9BACT|nr:hypothetical protein [Longimicrobium terrae]MBB4634726.1 hypothetical protein [Longimicrobium terrae]MBB6069121.1 hypothetical protein [Longimicrobium terrae]NNC32062.1 hypothetical protein [Longimicrobium terrae]